jgi:hypothetical protein
MAEITSPVNAANNAQTNICKIVFMKISGVTTRPGHRPPPDESRGALEAARPSRLPMA